MQLPVDTYGKSDIHMTTTKCGDGCGEDDWLKFKPSIRTEMKAYLNASERHVIVGARWVGRGISETADLLAFSHAGVFQVYKEWSEIEKAVWMKMSF